MTKKEVLNLQKIKIQNTETQLKAEKKLLEYLKKTLN